MRLKTNARRSLALLLVLAMLLASIPAGAADKYTPEDLFDHWIDLEEKWATAIADFNSGGNAELDETLSTILLAEGMVELYQMVEVALINEYYGDVSNKKDGSYRYDLEDMELRITKKEGRYKFTFSEGENIWTLQYSGNNNSLHATLESSSDGKKMIYYSDMIPTSKGIYTSSVIYVEGKAAMRVAKYMRDSVLYLVYDDISLKQDPADYRLTKAPSKYTDLAKKNSYIITLTEKGKLTMEHQGDKITITSK